MPRSTPNAKVEHTKVFGPEILLLGESLDEAWPRPGNWWRERNLTLVHPFDDEQVIAGQGTVGLELLEQVEGLDAVLVPVGGGGLIGGMGAAIKALAPGCASTVCRWNGSAPPTTVITASPDGGPGHVAPRRGHCRQEPWRAQLALIAAMWTGFFKVWKSPLNKASSRCWRSRRRLPRRRRRCLGGIDGQRGALRRQAGGGGRFRRQHRHDDPLLLAAARLVRGSRLVRLVIEIPDLPGALGNDQCPGPIGQQHH